MKQMISSMLAFVVQKHDGQFDKGGKPYVLHVLAVAHKLRTDDEELFCIALGHDVFEDTDATKEDLYAIGMTPRVVEGINCLTKMPGESYKEYQAKVLSNPDAIKVKMKDLLHNSDLRRLKGISDKDLKRVQKYMVFYHLLQENSNDN
ncbi:MAG: hypothetical protein P4M11_01950 [Candidatus Pacebacteria bacterium]|nr:hypothetical protein [Candidatus Paceibacterota bacterium]